MGSFQAGEKYYANTLTFQIISLVFVYRLYVNSWHFKNFKIFGLQNGLIANYKKISRNAQVCTFKEASINN